KGVAPVLQALTANEIQLSVASSGVAGGLLRSGKLKALAFASTPRHLELSTIPTTAEQGMPELQASIWFAIAAPAGTPAAIISKLNADMSDVLLQPVFLDRFITSVGWSVVGGSPSDMDAAIQRELAIIRDIITNSPV